MTNVKENYLNVKNEIKTIAENCGRNPHDILLVAVSKKHTCEIINKGIAAGIEILGENYIQEATDKIELIGNKTVSWHFIGHLQSNKAKYAVKYFDLIHSVDTIKLAREINKQAKKINKIQNILMQINISGEESKSGADEKDAIILAEQISRLPNINLQGLMGMPPFYNDPEKARPYFSALFNIKEAINNEHIQGVNLLHLSMGMSGDFQTAIEEGSTMVRVGTAIFGPRQ